MTTQTHGERAINALTGKKIDRVPFGVGLGWYPWPETLAKWRKETGREDLNPALELGYDPSFQIPAVHSGIFPPFAPEVLSEDDTFVTVRDDRGITHRARKDGGSVPEFIDYPVKTVHDWIKLKNERLMMAPERLVEDWDQFSKRLEATGTSVQVGHYPWGVFGTCRDLMGAEAFLVAFHTEPDMIKDMMAHLTGLWIDLWEEISKHVQIDHIHIWEDMSGKNGTLISPAMMEEFMMDCYDRIKDFASRHNVRLISVDSDGDCKELVSVMKSHGVNVFFPFEVQAGNDILQFRTENPELGIIGGLNKRALTEGKAAIDREVEKAARMIELGRYIPCLDHLVPPDISWQDFEYFASSLKPYCYGEK